MTVKHDDCCDLTDEQLEAMRGREDPKVAAMLPSPRSTELRQRLAEAERLLRAAYADTHPEDVPLDVLAWLNPWGNDD